MNSGLNTRGDRRRPARRAGAAGVAVVIGLVIIQLMVIATVIAGTRDQDLTLQRADTVRAFYAAEAGAQMSMREMMLGVDADGDGTIGSIAGGIVANGPVVNNARMAVGVDVTGQVHTLTVRGASGSCVRAMSLNLNTSGTPMTPVVSYATAAAPKTPAVREFTGGAWGAAVATAARTGDVRWQVLRNSPLGSAAGARALVTLTQDAALSLSRFSAGSWGAPSTLTTGTGTVNTRVFAAEYESRSGRLMVAYRKAASTSIYFRSYDTATPAEQSFAPGLSAAPTWMEIAAKPGGNEMVLVTRAGSNLYASVWNGASWGNHTVLSGAAPTAGRPFHVAYMTQSGAAMVVWTATSGAPRYATWDGAAWSASYALPAIAGNVPAGWVKIVGSPVGNEVLMACIGTNNQINVNRWSGSAWGSNLVVETAAAANTEPRVDVAYQRDGAAGLVVWHKSGQNSLRYRTWNGSAWSSQATGPNMTSETSTIRLEPGENPTEIVMLARRVNSGYADYHVYSQGGSVTTGTTVLVPPIASGGGLSLPTPPSGVANGTNISPSGGTVAPGTYGSMSHSGTVTFTAGTYIFSSITVNGTLNFNTTAGPIIFIVTNGGVTGSNENNNSFINTGTGPVQINVLNGDFDMKNNTTFTNIDVVVYNGNFYCKNNTDGSLNVYASGDIDFKNNGTINLNTYSMGGPPACSAVLWTGGVPGARVDLSTSLAPAGTTDPCGFAGSPISGSAALDSWAAVAP